MNDIPTLTCKEFIDNCQVLKAQYQELCVPFFIPEAIRCWKKMIYSLDIINWKKDKITRDWEIY